MFLFTFPSPVFLELTTKMLEIMKIEFSELFLMQKIGIGM